MRWWEFEKSPKIREFSEPPAFSGLSANFRLLRTSAHSWISAIRLQIGYFGSISRHFPTVRLRIASRWEFKMALAICGPPATFGARRRSTATQNTTVNSTFLSNFCHYWVHPSKYLADGDSKKRQEFANFQNSSSFPNLQKIFRLLRKSAQSWISEIRLEIGYLRLNFHAFWQFSVEPSTAGNSEYRFFCTPPGTIGPHSQNTTGNWPFLPNFHPFSGHPHRKYYADEIQNFAEYSRISEISGIF